MCIRHFLEIGNDALRKRGVAVKYAVVILLPRIEMHLVDIYGAFVYHAFLFAAPL